MADEWRHESEEADEELQIEPRDVELDVTEGTDEVPIDRKSVV